MKVWSIFFSVFLIAGLAMAQTTGTESWVDSGDVLHFPMTNSAPVIDGDLDMEAWYATPVIKLLEISGDHPTSPMGTPPDDYLDLTGECRAMWDADNFYFFARVIDDFPGENDSGTSHENDNFELFFDGDNSKNPAGGLSGDDIQWRWVYGGTVGETSGGNDVSAWIETDYGYNFEMQIPLTDFPFPVAAGNEIGFEIHLCDRDEGVRAHKLCWWNGSDNAWQEAAVWGTAMFSTVTVGEFLPIYKVDSAPTIDGASDDAWDAYPLFPTNCWVQDAEPFDFEAFDSYFGDDWIDFRVAYDDDFFYGILYKRDEMNTNPSADHNNDSVEMYWDGDNSKASSYDGVDDVQWRWISDGTADFTKCEEAVVSLGEPRTGDDGYLIEFSAAFGAAAPDAESGLPFTPSEGDLIGFEVQTNDNDDEGPDDNRETCARWWSDDNGSWADASLFGTAEMLGLIPSAVMPEPQKVNDFALAQNYPNPFNPTTNIRYELKTTDMVKLAVYDMLGRQVATLVNEVQSAGPQVVTFDASAMTSGVYFYKLEAGDQVFTRKMTLLK